MAEEVKKPVAKKAASAKPKAEVASEKPAVKEAVAKKPTAAKKPAAPAKAVKEAVVKEKPVAPAKAVKEVVAKEAVKVEVTTPVKENAAPKAKAKKALPGRDMERLEAKYHQEIKKVLMEKFHYKSIMEVPKVAKIVVNVGVGDATVDSKRLEDSVNELTLITGQKPITTKSKNSIATFKLREGQAIGCKVTLRGKKMYDFLDKLININLPRVRDFRGISQNAYDGRGNYTLGIKEQLIFPEIDYDKVKKIRGMDVTIITTAKNDEEAHALLSLLGMPFQK